MNENMPKGKREIKFRAWVPERRRYIMFGFNDIENGVIYVNEPDCEAYSLDDCEIEQYTGMNDKNGREIYEGDLVQWGDSERGEIRWIGLNTAFNTMVLNGGWLSFVPPVCEIIGNIYENPDLLDVCAPPTSSTS